MRTLFGSPRKVIFCKKCNQSNQRPCSVLEYQHDFRRTGALYLNIDDNNVCNACNYVEKKFNTIDWKKREEKLLRLLDKYRKSNGEYDCLVPGSGGKDSTYAAHILKYKYGMNPLTSTWPPILYTDYGYKNYLNWLKLHTFIKIF